MDFKQALEQLNQTLEKNCISPNIIASVDAKVEQDAMEAAEDLNLSPKKADEFGADLAKIEMDRMMHFKGTYCMDKNNQGPQGPQP